MGWALPSELCCETTFADTEGMIALLQFCVEGTLGPFPVSLLNLYLKFVADHLGVPPSFPSGHS